MYMSILGKPTDQDLDQYPMYSSHVHMDPSLLEYSHTISCGYSSWAPDPSARGQHDP